MLPPELLQSIFSHVKDQPTLHASTLVARTWYKSATPFLYANPIIDGSNFDAFVRAICPSVNAHIRTNGLAELVRRLDMSRLVHNGSKSLTARILGRMKGNMEEFVAPQASFAINCLAALSKCTKLRLLDLSFVSESIAISDLLRSTASLPKLEILHLPRSSGHETNKRPITGVAWPAKLRELRISGGLSDESVSFVTALPQSVSSLSIGNCPRLSMLTIRPLLEIRGPQLHRLEIVAPIPELGVARGPLDNVMNWAPNLRYLKISVDFLTADLFDLSSDEEDLHQESLKIVYLHCFDPSQCEYLGASDVLAGIYFGKLTGVRILGIHERLGWRDDERSIEVLWEINRMLKRQAEEEGPEAEIPVDEAGIRFYGTR